MVDALHKYLDKLMEWSDDEEDDDEDDEENYDSEDAADARKDTR